jgi:hypothetical protein
MSPTWVLRLLILLIVVETGFALLFGTRPWFNRMGFTWILGFEDVVAFILGVAIWKGSPRP